MNRNTSALTAKEYDLVIVGGGVFGICAAWDAVLRGLSVAILEKRDFSHATSANHFKMVHGGVRYLQHMDVVRIRESSRERSALLRIAPHLIQPLPIVIPTYGHGIKGKELLALGMWMYDILTLDRNWGIQSERQIPKARFISRDEVMERFSEIKANGLTGGAVFYDGQFYNPPRFAISVLRSAVERGAVAANYMEVNGFLRKGNRVFGVKSVDALSGDQVEVRAKMVLNAAGPWAQRLLEKFLNIKLKPKLTFSRDLAFVVKKKTEHGYGLAFLTKTRDSDAFLDRGGRHLFAVPWKDYTLIGVWPLVFSGPPEDIAVTDAELDEFIKEANDAYPGLHVSLDDILMINTGLTLHGEEGRQGQQNISYGHRSILVDHSLNAGLEGLITLIGVRATTARGMAEKAINMTLTKLGKNPVKCKTNVTPVYGGSIYSFSDYLDAAIRDRAYGLSADQLGSLVHNYGSNYQEVMKYTAENPDWITPIGNSGVLKVEVIHAVREEMAHKLGDVIFRRTDLGTAGYPGDAAVHACTDLMAMELNWDSTRKEKEIEEVQHILPQFC